MPMTRRSGTSAPPPSPPRTPRTSTWRSSWDTRTSAPAKRCSTWAAAPGLWPCRSARRGTRWWRPISPRACWIRCRRALDEAGVRTVFPKLMSWEDDWPAFGVREGMTDVAVASRSIATADLRDALLRLTEVARRRVCITLATGSSPRVDERILAAVGLPAVLGRDYLYAFNILAAEGIKAEVRYIDSTRDDTFASPEDAYEKLAAMIDDSSAVRASDTERQRARAQPTGMAYRQPRSQRERRRPRPQGHSPARLAPRRAPHRHLGLPRLERPLATEKGPGAIPGPLASCRFLKLEVRDVPRCSPAACRSDPRSPRTSLRRPR